MALEKSDILSACNSECWIPIFYRSVIQNMALEKTPGSFGVRALGVLPISTARVFPAVRHALVSAHSIFLLLHIHGKWNPEMKLLFVFLVWEWLSFCLCRFTDFVCLRCFAKYSSTCWEWLLFNSRQSNASQAICFTFFRANRWLVMGSLDCAGLYGRYVHGEAICAALYIHLIVFGFRVCPKVLKRLFWGRPSRWRSISVLVAVLHRLHSPGLI